MCSDSPSAVVKLVSKGSISTPLAPQTGSENQRERSAEALIREAHEVLAGLNFHMSASRVSRLCRRYLREGREAVDFRSWVTDTLYLDPTGETAAWNIVRGGRRA